MGLGLLGRGVGDAEFLAKCGAEVLVTDKKSAKELKKSVDRLSPYPNITFRLGEHQEEDFTSPDFVLKANGVRLDSPYIASAREADVPVYMSTAIFAKYAIEAGAKIVGVTGTRGKSTVTHMIFHVLSKVIGSDSVHLGGNVRGISTLAMLPEIKKDDLIVLELDSWQLQGFGDLNISPSVAIFTNFMKDHLDYYPDMDTYFNDKANIFKYQKTTDALIVGENIAPRISAEQPPVTPTVAPSIPADWQLEIVGEHNRENASIAAEALRALDLNEVEIQKGLESFSGVEGRLQLLGEVNGVAIYNDNNSTTPEATIAGLRALGNGVVLITGGSDKGLDFTDLLKEMQDRCKGIVFLAGTGTDNIKKDFPDAPVQDSLKDALDTAIDLAGGEGVILFSPAFASFGMFRNEYDRGDQFIKLVNQL